MAGTTFDDGNRVYRILREEVSRASGHQIAEELVNKWTGTSKLTAIRGLLDAVGSAADPVSLHAEFEIALERSYRESPPAPYVGLEELFERLRADGVKIALQTGYSRSTAGLLLEGAGWSVGEQIDAIVTSDEVPQSRPAPYMIFRTMEATGVTSVRDVLVAGDTVNDLGAGMNAGVGFVVGVLTGAQGIAELGSVPHTHILESVLGIEALAPQS